MYSVALGYRHLAVVWNCRGLAGTNGVVARVGSSIGALVCLARGRFGDNLELFESPKGMDSRVGLCGFDGCCGGEYWMSCGAFLPGSPWTCLAWPIAYLASRHFASRDQYCRMCHVVDIKLLVAQTRGLQRPILFPRSWSHAQTRRIRLGTILNPPTTRAI